MFEPLYIQLFIKYSLLYFSFFSTGRAFVLILQRIYFKNYNIPSKLLTIKATYLFPIIGIIGIGNLLIFLNFFIPLKSIFIYLLIICINVINLNNRDKFNFSNLTSYKILVPYLLVPAVLIISTSDINFHYDAAYYHLNHQNWLRESNMILGMVNIFWAFGMSSIYEYISAILWFDSTFVLLHFLNLIFIHFFYLFLFYHISNFKNKALTYSSIFILLFSLLDNFGFQGGRNGYFYIQGVGKQDTAVSVLFCFVTLVIINYLINSEIHDVDIIYTSLILFFIFQIKISGVFVFLIYLFLIFTLLLKNQMKFINIIYYNSVFILFSVIWFLKSYLTTGCILFPVELSCINNFSWYVSGSTKEYELISTDASFSYIEYFVAKDLSIVDWFNDFFNSENYESFSTYYRSFYLNFSFSLLLIIVLIFIFMKTKKVTFLNNIFIWSYLFFNLSYLVFFGPIPRYSIGVLVTIIGVLGFYVKDSKYELNRKLLYVLFVSSLILLPRINSYKGFLDEPGLSLFDPRIDDTLYNEVQIYKDWIRPDNGDRCWINLNCTMHTQNIDINTNNFFKIASRDFS